jgi:hypothetical protein
MTIGNTLLVGLGELERHEWVENEWFEITWYEMKGRATMNEWVNATKWNDTKGNAEWMNECMNEWMKEWMNEW